MSFDRETRLRELALAEQWTRQMIADTRGRPLQDVREYIDRVRAEAPLATGVKLQVVKERSIVGTWITREDWRKDRTVLYVHGGGFQFGSSVSHVRAAAHICAAAGASGFVVDYRLAPEHRFPIAIGDCVNAYGYILSTGIAASQVAFVGDSAGGNLVVATMLGCRANGRPQPACGVCLSPWVNLVCDGETIALNKDVDPSGQTNSLGENVRAYLGDADPTEPLASPILADLSGLPPLLIQVGTREILLDDARRLAAAAKRAGVQVVLEEWPDMIHNWHMLPELLSDAVKANRQIGEFIGRVWNDSPSGAA